jgi:thioredoxin-like negative regulator of GroEL
MNSKQIVAEADLDVFCKENHTVLVYFYATWCEPCRTFDPYVTKQCKDNNIALAKVDVDAARHIKQKYGIEAMPTIKVLD